MTKIAIISQAEQGVLIDISGCSSLSEAKQYLTSTLQVSSQFWEGLVVDLNLGPLVLTPEQVSEIQTIVSDVGVQPRQIFSLSPITRSSLIQCRLPLGGLGQLNCYVPMRTAEWQNNREGMPSAESLAGNSVAALQQLVARADGSAEALPMPSVSGQESACPGIPESAAFTLMTEPAADLTGMTEQSPRSEPAAAAKAPPTAQKSGPKKALPKPPQAAVLMMKQTLRSGQRVCHNGHLVIIGDVNPGAELVADGDITVWGALRGMAHAGASGDINAEIRALKFGAIQLRIAQAIARSPDRHKISGTVPSGPETARVIDGKIRLSLSDPE